MLQVLLQRKLAQAHEERVQLEDELRNREQQVEATKQLLEGARQQAEGARQQVEVLKGQLEAARLRAADADRAEREVAAMRQQLEQMKQVRGEKGLGLALQVGGQSKG